MSIWPLVFKGLDFLFERAIRIDRYLDEKNARKKRGLTFKDVQYQQDQIASATRSRTPTVVMRRPPPR